MMNEKENDMNAVSLDPPFFSSRNDEGIRGDVGEVRSFQDRRAGGIGRYTAVTMNRRADSLIHVLPPLPHTH
jgi:hypothetical protein